MADQTIPLTSAPNQQLSVSLNVDGGIITLRLTVRFSEMAQYWVMTIADAYGNVLIDSVPMVTGEYPAANLLVQYGYLGIGSAYVINVSGVADDLPNARNLGSDYIVIWGDTAA